MSCSFITEKQVQDILVDMVKHSPSPSVSCTHVLPSAVQVSHVPGADSTYESSSSLLNDLHIPAQLMEDFLDLARENTDKDMETCGVLGAYLKGGVFYAITLVIPKHESTSSSCQASSEEEIFAVLNEQSLLPVGWIHTHPSQSCFMSSIDLHTQYSYQLRRERITERVKALQELVPSCNKTDRAAMLDEILDYVKFLRLQVKVLSMSRLGGAGAVAQLVADNPPSSDQGDASEVGSNQQPWEKWANDGTEQEVAKLMEKDVGAAMQFLQSKALCIMPVSLAAAIFSSQDPPSTHTKSEPNT